MTDILEIYSPMIPSYIQEIPNGTEKGTFLALDLGGTNLRVCEVTLLGESKWTMKQQKYKVSDSLKMGDVSQLFDYIAGSVDHFLTEIGTDASEDEKLHLGFTFSFPVLQTALAAGTLINWTKVSFTKSSRMSPFLERRIQIVYVFFHRVSNARTRSDKISFNFFKTLSTASTSTSAARLSSTILVEL